MTDTGNDSGELTSALTRIARALEPKPKRVLGWVIVAGVVVAVVRLAQSPDAGRTTVMHVARKGEQYAMWQARIWVGVADRSNSVYNRARSVNA